MKLNFLGKVFVVFSLLLTHAVKASLIIDTSNNSFIDTKSGLEWMDFGINNHQTYNQIRSELNTTYLGWNLAYESQVVELFDNAFDGLYKDAIPRVNYDYFNTDNNDLRMLTIFNIMGLRCDVPCAESLYFEDGSNWMAQVSLQTYLPSNLPGSDLQRASISYLDENDPDFSILALGDRYGAMLVRPVNEVTEPNSYFIIGFMFLVLVAQRKSKLTRQLQSACS